MRKWLIVVAGVVGVGALAYFGFTSPWVLERTVEWSCQEPSERCTNRMRALAHIWSHHGKLDRAAHWYERAATAGDPASMFHLAWTYEMRGTRDLHVYIGDLAKVHASDIQEEPTLSRGNLHAAADWYRRAAEAGFAPAMNNLGNLYGQGLLGRADREQAFRWHLAAARAGNPVGAFNVSLAYREGRGTARDSAAADKWAIWSPVNFNERDLASLTLIRTQFSGNPLADPVRQRLLKVAKDGPPSYAVLDIKPMKPDPRLPPFNDVQRRLTEGKGR